MEKILVVTGILGGGVVPRYIPLLSNFSTIFVGQGAGYTFVT